MEIGQRVKWKVGTSYNRGIFYFYEGEFAKVKITEAKGRRFIKDIMVPKEIIEKDVD